MTAWWQRVWISVGIGWLGFGLNGCAPAGEPSDAQREPHFVLGENRINAADYRGAIRAFAESLEADPRLAAAHLELAWLYDEKVPDPAAAIYHYERYLKLEPGAGNAVAVNQRIEACKRKLAVAVFSLPSTVGQQQQLEKLVEQHQQLQDEVRRLQADLNGWNAYYASVTAARTKSQPAPATVSAAPPDRLAARGFGSWRTHVVVAGETAYGIARRCGVPLEALLAANPGLEPRRMAVGQVLKLPSRGPFLDPAARLFVGGASGRHERAVIASRAEPGLE